MAKIRKNDSKSEKNRNRVRFHRAVNHIIQNNTDNSIRVNHHQLQTADQVHGIRETLRQWAIQYNITRSAIDALLKILILYGMTTLPRDSRTLLSTPRKVQMIPFGNGQFWYDMNLNLDFTALT